MLTILFSKHITIKLTYYEFLKDFLSVKFLKNNYSIFPTKILLNAENSYPYLVKLHISATFCFIKINSTPNKKNRSYQAYFYFL